MLEVDVYNKLKEITNEVYPIFLNENYNLPALTYLNVSVIPNDHLKGDGLEHSRFQIDIYAKTYKETKDLFLVLKIKMRELTSTLLSSQDLYEDETKTYRVSVDYSVWKN